MIRVARLLTVVLLGVMCAGVVQTANAKGNLSDQELKSVNSEFDRAIQRFDGWLTRMYQLTPEQREQVVEHLKDLKQAQIDWGPKAEAEMNDISQEMRYYMEQARQGKPVDKQKVQELPGTHGLGRGEGSPQHEFRRR